MHEHLVDDDLEEQRRDEGKELKEERDDQHLAEEMAVLVDGPQEPRDVEAAREVRQFRSARHQDKAAIPNRLELSARHRFGSRRRRLLDEDLVLADLAEDEEPTIAQRRYPGQRGAGETFPVRRGRARLEPEVLSRSAASR